MSTFMDIQEFFQLCDGKWVSQRTTHYLVEQKNQSDRSDLWIDFVDATDSDLAKLSQHFSIRPEQIYGGLKVRWSEVAEAYQSRFKTQKTGSALVIPVADSDHPTAGKLLRQLGTDSTAGTYSFGSDEALTIVLKQDGLITEERIWFVSPNLRLRSSITQRDETVQVTSFCSEIRMGLSSSSSSDAEKDSETSKAQSSEP